MVLLLENTLKKYQVGNIEEVVGNLWKIIKKVIILMFIQQNKYMVACRYGISSLVFNFISHLFAAFTYEASNREMRKEIQYQHTPMYYSVYIT